MQKRSFLQKMSSFNSFLFRQFFDAESSTFTYLIADAESKEAFLIDPVLEQVERDLQIVKELDLKLDLVLNTHVHADHITGSGKIKTLLGPCCKSALAKTSGGNADILFNDGDEFKFGKYTLKAIATPGHTLGCTSFYLQEQGILFTGDSVLIRGCGRTDFQGGNSSDLYDSIHSKIFTLPEFTAIYPGHDYKGRTSSTVGEEKLHNARFTKPKQEFINIMANLDLSYPKKIDVAVPANLKCGL
jgi:sulfur dioxygenase